MKKEMRRFFIILLGALLLLTCTPASGLGAGPAQIDVLYMNHGPLQPILKDLRAVFARYGEKLQVSWHDFESKEGAAFMTKKGIHGHVPLWIWLNDRDALPVDGKEVRFQGFPTGTGPAFFQGKWTVAGIGKAIDEVIAKK